jgi:hypothetical protein
MKMPVFFKLLDEGEELLPVVDLIRFMNTNANDIAEAAWRTGVIDGAGVEAAAKAAATLEGVHASIASATVNHVVNALARNSGAYRPTFDAIAPVLVAKKSGMIEFDPYMYTFSIETLQGRLNFDSDGFPPLPELLACRNGEYGLILDLKHDATEVNDAVCYAAVLCDVESGDRVARRMVEWMPYMRREAGAPSDAPNSLETLIPLDHPLRDCVSGLELRDAPFFSVKALSIVMNLPAGRIYPKLDRKEIAHVRGEAGIKIPRDEFMRICRIHLNHNEGIVQAIRMVMPDIERVGRILRQTIEPLSSPLATTGE